MRWLTVILFVLASLVSGCGSAVSITIDWATKTPGSDGQSLVTPAKLPAAKVVKVVDGDTVDVELNGKTERLRAIGINTPETVDPRKPVECFGKEASDWAKVLLTNQTVFLEADPSQQERDQYNRLLRYIWLPDGRLFNLEMIAQGYAYEYTYSVPYKYQAVFKQAQQDAQNRQQGLWSPQTCNGQK
jgi:micrococcal nuclease